MSFYHDDIYDAALNALDVADELWLVEGYTNGDSYATCSTNKRAGTDTFTLGAVAAADAAGENGRKRVISAGTSLGNATASATGLLSYILVDTGNSKVIGQGAEASGQDITSGNPVVAGEITFRFYNVTT